MVPEPPHSGEIDPRAPVSRHTTVHSCRPGTRLSTSAGLRKQKLLAVPTYFGSDRQDRRQPPIVLSPRAMSRITLAHPNPSRRFTFATTSPGIGRHSRTPPSVNSPRTDLRHRASRVGSARSMHHSVTERQHRACRHHAWSHTPIDHRSDRTRYRRAGIRWWPECAGTVWRARAA